MSSGDDAPEPNTDNPGKRFADLSAAAHEATVIVQAVNSDGVSITGSGFVCSHNGRYYVVAAAHVVKGAIQLVGHVDLVVFIRDLTRRRVEKIAISVSAPDWYVPAIEDVAIGLLRTGGELDVRGVSSLQSDLLLTPIAWHGPLPVQYYGTVTVGAETIVLGRTGEWASPEIMSVKLETLGKPINVALVEGTNTPGMSGGVVVVHDRQSIGILGLISGYCMPRMKQRPSPKGSGQQLVQLFETLDALNLELLGRRHLIVYVTPRAVIGAALTSADAVLI